MEIKPFKDLLKDERIGWGMTQAEVGEIIGTDDANVSRLESGVRAPTARQIEAICSSDLVKFVTPHDWACAAAIANGFYVIYSHMICAKCKRPIRK